MATTEGQSVPRQRQRPSFHQTEFWRSLMDDIYGPRNGGAIILVDAEDARKGVGKTGCAVAVSKLLARRFAYSLQLEDMVISGNEYMERLRSHPGKEQPSVVVWDEAVGGGSGDGRRAMSNQNVVMGRAWQTLRAKRIVHLVTLPDLSDLDSRLIKLADYRLYCLRRPIGYMKAYEIGTPFDPQTGGIHTRGLGPDDVPQRIQFPDVTKGDDPHYNHLAQKKAQLNDSSSFDADEELSSVGEDGEEQVDPDEARRQEKIELAQELVNKGWTQDEVADVVDRGQAWVSRNTEQPEDDDS